VVLMSIRQKENLLRAMVTGWKWTGGTRPGTPA
jgi:hypothetical protein